MDHGLSTVDSSVDYGPSTIDYCLWTADGTLWTVISCLLFLSFAVVYGLSTVDYFFRFLRALRGCNPVSNC